MTCSKASILHVPIYLQADFTVTLIKFANYGVVPFFKYKSLLHMMDDPSLLYFLSCTIHESRDKSPHSRFSQQTTFNLVRHSITALIWQV